MLCAVLLFSTIVVHGQQTNGLFLNTPESLDGYTLFGGEFSKVTYLINNCGEKVHSWTSQYDPGLSCYLMEDGTLLRTGRITGMGGGSGIVEMIDWNGNVFWSHSVTATHGRQHHDIELLPNGNILLIVWDERTQAEVTQAGGVTTNNSINSEQIVEIQPDIQNGGAVVVWEWKAWDHLVQEAEPTKDNFDQVGNRPERIDMNFLNLASTDWLHFNGVDYNEEFDQIIISNRKFSELWIIDHSTTTAEATSSSGGNSGKGGDLLYRWGNSRAYNQGTPNDQKLFFQHDTQWIPENINNEGKILMFNNQAGTLQSQNYSEIGLLEPPIDANGNYLYSSGAWGPSDFNWTYQAPNPQDFYSNIISGVQPLENGNMLICEGVPGRFFEIDDNEEIVWEYVNPVNDLGPQAQETVMMDNNTFRCTRYTPDYPGLQGHDLTPQGYIETGSTHLCDLYPAELSVASQESLALSCYPNPTDDKLTVLGSHFTENLNVTMMSVSGAEVKSNYQIQNDAEINFEVGNLDPGVYFIQIQAGEFSSTIKVNIN